ncbi:hypothetical protein N7457_005602 [Penicillium paradoxum]|uniref:uncharacterized protein n=1 Tax=Penicillium paradoxum TaxID=176176 RepID=UPI0025475E73|nr:uncharacterized protein N7457_005602 [Penicillium paradoxum]KAJ5780442.1 hypothetical protein N7457_005602 [Penicillium paradoxum]
MHINPILTAIALALPVYSLSATAKMGCYSEVESFKSQGPYTYQSLGYCQNLCAKKEFKVAALSRGDMCYCGDDMPSDSAKVDDDQCDMTCPGWPEATCGGKESFTLIQAIENIRPPRVAENASTTIAPTAATAAGGIIVAPSTAVAPTGIVTAASSTNSKSANTGLPQSGASGSTLAASSASPTPANNAAVTVRAGSALIGAVLAGMGLLL